jgi:hypothetical protein
VVGIVAEPTNAANDAPSRPIDVLMRADRRAGELRRADGPPGVGHWAPTMFNAAPTHSAAYLLQALRELGIVLVESGELAARVERALDLERDVERMTSALTSIRDHGTANGHECWALHQGDCAEVFQEIARAALEGGATHGG